MKPNTILPVKVTLETLEDKHSINELKAEVSPFNVVIQATHHLKSDRDKTERSITLTREQFEQIAKIFKEV